MSVFESKNKILKPIEKEPFLDVIDQIATLFSAGNFYYFILNFETLNMDYVSDGTQSVLGIDSNDFTLNKFLDLLNPEDLEKIHEKEAASLNFKLNKIPKEDIIKYKTVYILRVKLKNGETKTLLHQAKVLNLSEDGKVFQVMSIHTDVTYLNPPIDHKISFISNERPSYYSLETGENFSLVENNFKTIFTSREIEVIEKLSKGYDFNEIAKLLYVSPHTINTHKRNILRKSNCRNTAELITKCIREGVI